MEKREKIAIKVLILITLALLLIRNVMEVTFDTKGESLYDYEQELSLAQERHNKLYIELLRITSLHYLYDEAKKRGFVDAIPGNVLYP